MGPCGVSGIGCWQLKSCRSSMPWIVAWDSLGTKKFFSAFPTNCFELRTPTCLQAYYWNIGSVFGWVKVLVHDNFLNMQHNSHLSRRGRTQSRVRGSWTWGNISYLQVCPRPGPKANRGVGLSWRGPGCPISGDISQWTDRHLITFGCSRAPFASLDFSLVMFTSFIPWLVTQVHTDSAGKGPLCSSYSEAFVSSMSRTSPVWGMRVEKSWVLATVFSAFSSLGDEAHHEGWKELSHCFLSIFYNPRENNDQGYTKTIIPAHVPGQHILSWQQSRPQPFIDTYYGIGHRLEMKFSLCTIFAQCSQSSSSTSETWELRTWN